jgi:hypothetical protein
MPEVLELDQVQMSQTGERRTPDPDLDRLKLDRGGYEVVISVGIHRADVHAPATPESLLVGNLNHPCLRLRKPIKVFITRDDALLIASIPELEEFGYGSHLTAAVEDLRQTLIELYCTLKAEQSRLGPDMIQLWTQLQELIKEK